MFAVLYKFKVKEGCEKDFTDAWKRLTLLIYEYAGSNGSRLHVDKDGFHIAYAIWPDREFWEEMNDKLPEEKHELREKMHSYCESIETLHEMEITADLLARD